MFRCIRTPLYIECWILLLINLHCMWRCRNLSLLFIHCTVLIRTLQNPTSAVFTIMLHVYVAKSFCRSLTFLWCNIWSVSVNFNQMNYKFFSPSKLLNKNIFINWFLFVHMEVLICNSTFLQDRFHSDWIAFFWNI